MIDNNLYNQYWNISRHSYATVNHRRKELQSLLSCHDITIRCLNLSDSNRYTLLKFSWSSILQEYWTLLLLCGWASFSKVNQRQRHMETIISPLFFFYVIATFWVVLLSTSEAMIIQTHACTTVSPIFEFPTYPLI